MPVTTNSFAMGEMLAVLLSRDMADGEKAIVGLSITDSSQLVAVDPDAVDYLGIGPVFATGTKPDAAPAQWHAGADPCHPAR